MPIRDLVQMIAALSEIKDRQTQFDLQRKQMADRASEFATEAGQKEFFKALELMAGSSASGRQALSMAIQHMKPEYQQQVKALMQNPVAPQVLGAEAANRGVAAMTPTQRGAFDQEAAAGAVTGMNVGQVGGSQMVGSMTGVATPQPGLVQNAGGPQAFQTMAQQYLTRQTSGMDPLAASTYAELQGGGLIPKLAQIQAGGMSDAQAAQMGLSGQQLSLAQAEYRQRDRHFLATYGLNLAEATAAVNKSTGLTADKLFEVQKEMASLLDNIEKNTASEGGNIARIKQYNSFAIMIGRPDLLLDTSKIKGMTPAPSQVHGMDQFLNRRGVFSPQVPMPATAPPAVNNVLPPAVSPPTAVVPRPAASPGTGAGSVDTVALARQQQAAAKADSDALAFNTQQIQNLQAMVAGGVSSPALAAEIQRLQNESRAILARHPNWPVPRAAQSWMR